MKILLIEDEIPASKRLTRLLDILEPNWQIVDILDEISSVVDWIQKNPRPDLIFMDIHLADGFSFEIFNQIEIKSKVIFVTAYDQYALKAFEVNGLDYLLKPIKKEELKRSIDRFKESIAPEKFDFKELSEFIQHKKIGYKERFLIKSGGNLSFVQIQEIAYFISESSYSFIVTNSGNRYIIDSTLDQIESELNPDKFFRINRSQIVGINSILKITNHINNRLKLELNPADNESSIVSRKRVAQFKEWLNQ